MERPQKMPKVAKVIGRKGKRLLEVNLTSKSCFLQKLYLFRFVSGEK